MPRWMNETHGMDIEFGAWEVYKIYMVIEHISAQINKCFAAHGPIIIVVFD